MVTRDFLLERDPDELERDLIEHGRRDRAPDTARRRTLASVTIAVATGAGLATTSVSAGATAVAGAAPWLVSAKWLAGGVLAGALTLGVADGVKHRAIAVRREVSVPIAAPVVLPTSPVGLPIPPSSTVDVPTEIDVPSQTDTARDPPGRAPALSRNMRASARIDEPSNLHSVASSPSLVPAAPASAGTVGESALVHEVRLLEEARGALDAHAAARALMALDRYADDFPRGRMAIEASALRIETLWRLGQRDTARALAQAFLAKHPQSPASMRVSRLLEAIDSGSAP